MTAGVQKQTAQERRKGESVCAEGLVRFGFVHR